MHSQALRHIKVALVALSSSMAMGSGAFAQNGWLRDGTPVEKQPNLATVGGFGVMQLATVTPDHLIADWQKATAGVNIATNTIVKRHQPIVTFIIFKGCKSDKLGKCNVTVDYQTLDPTGKISDTKSGVEVWVGHPPPPNFNLQLSASGYGLVIEDKDVLGDYHIRASVIDHVANTIVHTEQVLTAVAAEP